jgi:hypothetical protein
MYLPWVAKEAIRYLEGIQSTCDRRGSLRIGVHGMVATIKVIIVDPIL